MANISFIVILVIISIFKTHSHYYQESQNQYKGTEIDVCELDRTFLSGKKVAMIDGIKVQGLKVKFKPICALKEVDEYRGIQYADLTSYHMKSLRFLPNRQRGKSVTNTINNERFATQHKPVCPQMFMDEVIKFHKGLPEELRAKLSKLGNFTKKQTDGCLWLNLVVPEKEWNETEKLPVMIFIHGESYEVGTGNAYDGSVLASYGGVIVITVNYRLGVLGFLRTGDTNAVGNYALWDLVAILFWVQQNIDRFGGDAGRVTLFGHGHGAALVNFLLFTKTAKEKNLFNNVILQSGSAFSTWATSIDPVRCANLLARNVNCSHAVNKTKALVDCLRERSVDELVRSVPMTPKYYTCFAPSITQEEEGDFPRGHTLESLIESGKTRFANTKIMFGLTRKEAYSYLKQEEIEKGISEARKKQILRTYVQNVYKYNRQKIYEILNLQYTQFDRPSDNYTRRDEIMDLLSDGQYKAPLVKMALEHAKTADTYLYSFAYSTQSEDFAQWSGGVHGDELPYIFGAPLVGGVSPFPTAYTPQEKELSKFMMRMWTNFAKTGDPNLPEWDNAAQDRGDSVFFTGERWPKYNASSQSYLHIGRKGSKVKDFYRGKETALWLNLIPKWNFREPNSSNASHELEDSENMSTFDDPTRLINKFLTIFPSPPPPPLTPPFSPHQSDPEYVTPKDDLDNITYDLIDSSDKSDKISKQRATPTAAGPVVGKADESKRDDSSNNVPLSIVIAVGAGILFINILISAVTYFQRKRIAKLREANAQNVNHNNAGNMPDNRNSNAYRGRGGTPEAGNLVNTSEMKQQPKVASINHKQMTDNSPPVYTAISKPVVPPQGPGGYTYSALSQKTSSPMHSQNQTTSFTNVNPSVGPPSESGGSQASSRGSDNINRPHGHSMTPDRPSPKVDPRTKHIGRAGQQVTSNNAITIV
ncbi:neuroligin-4, Y-linked-like isoform X3 [Ruditapes philippinarum]|uniref:neuroligin-4, Y-linked-like isoform X3 n=1 Tax=Ruditapes philippinarum TaxID=129788 RepID=UPI00295A6673|nr:neuroligin-4, Y-linked-like isoform X3 [Ruditapes philippinarum]